jgi:hypothetical protein
MATVMEVGVMATATEVGVMATATEMDTTTLIYMATLIFLNLPQCMTMRMMLTIKVLNRYYTS